MTPDILHHAGGLLIGLGLLTWAWCARRWWLG